VGSCPTINELSGEWPPEAPARRLKRGGGGGETIPFLVVPRLVGAADAASAEDFDTAGAAEPNLAGAKSVDVAAADDFGDDTPPS